MPQLNRLHHRSVLDEAPSRHSERLESDLIVQAVGLLTQIHDDLMSPRGQETTRLELWPNVWSRIRQAGSYED